MKFHYPGCDSVKQMNESNRMNTNLSREELIAQGRCSSSGRAFSADRSEAETQPCGNCRP